MKDKEKRTVFLAKLALLAAAVIWGSSYFITKDTFDYFPIAWLLAIRYAISAVLFGIVFFRKWKLLNKEYLIYGGIIGVVEFAAFFIQMIGLSGTTPGKNAFLMSSYCIFVPAIAWLLARSSINRYQTIGAVICLTGVGFISLTGELRIAPGDAFTILSAALFALHIVLVARYGKNLDPVLFVTIQFIVSALLGFAWAIMTEEPPGKLGPMELLTLFYLAVFCTALSLLFQFVGQKHVAPSVASILMSTESVFALLFSIIFYGERLTLREAIGFALVLFAVLFSQKQVKAPPKEA